MFSLLRTTLPIVALVLAVRMDRALCSPTLWLLLIVLLPLFILAVPLVVPVPLATPLAPPLPLWLLLLLPPAPAIPPSVDPAELPKEDRSSSSNRRAYRSSEP